MQTQSLLRMANQIATFFEAMPDREEAMEGVAMHIKKFWEPRMRRQFLALADSPMAPDALNPLLADTLRQHRSLLE
jgi:formate dehydrogenase subunit delta